MEGFILAAGLGTRLRPLTNDRPKALVEIPAGRNRERMTLLEHTIHKLEAAGIHHIVVNIHHFADKVVEFLASNHWQAKIDISDERDLLLDTGGGLKKAGALFSGKENVLVHNVDILSHIDLRKVEEFHRMQENLVTLCVSQRNTKRLLAFDEKGLLIGRATDSSTTASRRSPSPNLGEELKSINRSNSTSPNLGEELKSINRSNNTSPNLGEELKSINRSNNTSPNLGEELKSINRSNSTSPNLGEELKSINRSNNTSPNLGEELKSINRSNNTSPNLGEELKSINRSNSSSPKLGEVDARRADGGVCTCALAFSGISIVSPELFALLPEADHPYPVIDEYIRLSLDGHRIGSYQHSPEHWLDVGKPETLELAKTFQAF